MGDVFARAVLGLPAPTIGLLNIGSEELKGDERVRQAAEVLRASHLGAAVPRLRRGRRHRRRHHGRGGDRRLHRQRGAEDGGGRAQAGVHPAAAGVQQQPGRPAGLSAGAARAGAAARVGRPAALQRRHHAGAERRGGEVAWRHGCRAVRLRDGRRDRHGGAPLQRAHPRRPGADRRAGRPAPARCWRRPADAAARGDGGRRRLPAGAGGDECRAGRAARHVGRVDRRAHRHPPAPHRRRRTRPPPSWAPARRQRPWRMPVRPRPTWTRSSSAPARRTRRSPPPRSACRRPGLLAASASTCRRRAAASSMACRSPTR